MVEKDKDNKTKTLELVGGIALVVLALVLVGVVGFAIYKRDQVVPVALIDVGGPENFP